MGTTAHRTATWAATKLVMDLEDEGRNAQFLIRDQDGKFPALFDQIVADAGAKSSSAAFPIPRMNAIMERRIRTCRHELLDRTLVGNQQHLLHALGEYEKF